MLTDLRVKLRTRRSRIASCGWEDFLPLTKQFYKFLDDNSVLKAVVAELLARNQPTVETTQNADPNERVCGDTAEEAATVGYLKWRVFSNQNNPSGFYSHALHGDFNQSSGMYKDWYIEPLFDYLDETLDDANVVLAMLIRYKQKVEWYRRAEVLRLYEDDTSRGKGTSSSTCSSSFSIRACPFTSSQSQRRENRMSSHSMIPSITSSEKSRYSTRKVEESLTSRKPSIRRTDIVWITTSR